eukprot:SM000019S05001  [mRNA]  locus=s19:471588:481603:+ [translate_table: standard]
MPRRRLGRRRTCSTTASSGYASAPDADDAAAADEPAALADFLDALYDKRASTRESGLRGIISALSSHVLTQYAETRLETLLQLFLTSVRRGVGLEVTLAARALGLLAVTLGAGDPADRVCAEATPLLHKIAKQALPVGDKTAALDAIALLNFVSSREQSELDESMGLMWQIGGGPESDQMLGSSHAAPEVRTAALSGWTLLLSTSSPAEITSQARSALPSLSSLLADNDLAMRIAAGEAIALLYEAGGRDGGEESSESTSQAGALSVEALDDKQAEVLERMRDLSVEGNKRLSKKTRKEQHGSFRDLVSLIKDGTITETSVRLKNGDSLTLSTWREIIQLNALRRYLAEGFQKHLQENELLHQIFGFAPRASKPAGFQSLAEKRMYRSPNSLASKARTRTRKQQRALSEVLTARPGHGRPRAAECPVGSEAWTAPPPGSALPRWHSLAHGGGVGAGGGAVGEVWREGRGRADAPPAAAAPPRPSPCALAGLAVLARASAHLPRTPTPSATPLVSEGASAHAELPGGALPAPARGHRRRRRAGRTAISAHHGAAPGRAELDKLPSLYSKSSWWPRFIEKEQLRRFLVNGTSSSSTPAQPEPLRSDLQPAPPERGIASEKDWGISLKNQPLSESGINEDGSTWYRESGEDFGENGYRCRWTVMGGRNADGSIEWKETWWEKSDWTSYKELGAEKSGRKGQDDSWWETWQETYRQDEWSGLARIEKSAHKQAKSRLNGVWNEKWWEKYNAKQWTEKGAHKYGRLNDQSWWEKWGEQYDGRGAVVKWTDKWAENDAGAKWGDKWEERFNNGVGTRQGETWHVSPSGARWSRPWGEEHYGTGDVHKYGQSTSGELWDAVVKEPTFYEAAPHYGWQEAVNNSSQLLAIEIRDKPPSISSSSMNGVISMCMPPTTGLCLNVRNKTLVVMVDLDHLSEARPDPFSGRPCPPLTADRDWAAAAPASSSSSLLPSSMPRLDAIPRTCTPASRLNQAPPALEAAVAAAARL